MINWAKQDLWNI